MSDANPVNFWRRLVANARFRLIVRSAAIVTIVVGLAARFGLTTSHAPARRAEVCARTETVEATPATIEDGSRIPSAPRWTAEQLKLKEQLEAQLIYGRTGLHLTLAGGRVIDGPTGTTAIISEEPRETGGTSVAAGTPVPCAAVLGPAPTWPEGFTVSQADVELFQEFPNFKFAKYLPYTVVTDESFRAVERLLAQLNWLRRQFEDQFAPLIRERHRPHNIQIVFFGKEEQFREYANCVAPAFVNSGGFYSLALDRLAILNQSGTRHYANLLKPLARRQRQLDQMPPDGTGTREDATRQVVAARQDLNARAQAITRRLINHEGAHQLFYAYRIHSPYGAEPTWLKEGLAEYCEPMELGHCYPQLAGRAAELCRAGRLLPLSTLLNYHDDTGFFGLDRDRAEAAFVESWALVYYLMQPEMRARFFEFIQRYRDVSSETEAEQLRGADTALGLAASLGLDVPTLESRWHEFLCQLN